MENDNDINTENLTENTSNSSTDSVTEIVAKTKTTSKVTSGTLVTMECRCGNQLNAVKANGDTVKCPECDADIKY